MTIVVGFRIGDSLAQINANSGIVAQMTNVDRFLTLPIERSNIPRRHFVMDTILDF